MAIKFTLKKLPAETAKKFMVKNSLVMAPSRKQSHELRVVNSAGTHELVYCVSAASAQKIKFAQLKQKLSDTDAQRATFRRIKTKILNAYSK